MTRTDELLLLGTGLIAIYLIWRSALGYRRTGARAHLFTMIAFVILLSVMILLLAFTYTALENPLLVTAAVLIPSGISAGLIARFLPQLEKPYLVFIAAGLAAVAVTRITGPAWLATATLVSVHATSGVVILGLPLWTIWRGDAPRALGWIALGGLLIDLGGVALAFLKAGSQLLFFSQEVVFTILAPLLLLMVMSFAWGFSHLPGQA